MQFHLLCGCATVWTLTVVIEKAFGFLISGCRDERSHKYVHDGHQQDDEQDNLCLWVETKETD